MIVDPKELEEFLDTNLEIKIKVKEAKERSKIGDAFQIDIEPPIMDQFFQWKRKRDGKA